MQIENIDFICPHCRGHLKPSETIIFSVKTRDGRNGLLLLSPKLGEYTILKHSSFKLREGEHLEFYCPMCHNSLSSLDEHINLAKIFMLDQNGKVSEIIFSKIVGEKCTYRLAGENIEPFGPDAREYYNYWGEQPEY